MAPTFVDPDSHDRIIIVKGASNGLLPGDVETGAHAVLKAPLVMCQLEIRMRTVAAAIALGKRLNILVLLNLVSATKGLGLEPVI